MSTTHKIKTWIDTGTGRQAESEIEVEVAGGVIIGDTAAGGSALQVYSSAALAVNDLVYVSGRNETLGFPAVTLADANAAGKHAQFVVRTAIGAGATGMVFTASRTAANVNTNAVTTAGDPVYLSETAGGWTATAPTGVTSTAQVVGHCAIKSATVGVIEFDLRDFPTVNRSDLQADAIDGTKIADDAVDSEHYAAASIDNEHLADDAVDSAELAAGAIDPEHFAAGAVTGPAITNAAFGLQGVAGVEVDHAAVSPFEVLAADADNDRIALVYAVAAEAAAGEPDIDIGVTNTINSVTDDFKAGAWVVGDRVFKLINIPKAENVRATITAAGTAGKLDVFVHVMTPTIVRANLEADIIDGTKLADNAVDSEHITAGSVDNAHLAGLITRANLLEEALAVYGVPAHALKSDAGAALLAAETGGTFNIVVAANVVSVQGEICDNETEVSVGYFQFVLRPEYVAAGDVKVRIKTALIKVAAAVNNGSTIDVEVYEQTGNGAVGADICATAAQSWAADDTWYTKDFDVTATSLVAGDILNVKVTTSVVDSEAGGGTLRANLDGIAMLLDIKG